LIRLRVNAREARVDVSRIKIECRGAAAVYRDLKHDN